MSRTPIARDLADWAIGLEPSKEDLELAQRSLVDTVAVAIAGRDHPVNQRASSMTEAGRWAVTSHVLDFDDLHMESTTHISVVCVPATLAVAGDAATYLGAAGVMARIGTALGWSHYGAGWHATCSAGAFGAAIAGGLALGLDRDALATALALAVPGAGGVQRAFGTDAKSLQGGFAVETGLRAARLAAAGATADLSAVDHWLGLVNACADEVDLSGPAVPGGLAVKIYPACYALQRPISALSQLKANGVTADRIRHIVLSTPEATVAPLIHHRPTTGLQAKFSLEYAAATALLDRHHGFAAFTDEAVRREDARRLVDAVEVRLTPGGDWLLDGELSAIVELDDGGSVATSLSHPPGSPQRPPTDAEFALKLEDCLAGTDSDHRTWTWATAADELRTHVRVEESV